MKTTTIAVFTFGISAVIFSQLGIRKGREMERADLQNVVTPTTMSGSFCWRSGCDLVVIDTIIQSRTTPGWVRAVVGHCK